MVLKVKVGMGSDSGDVRAEEQQLSVPLSTPESASGSRRGALGEARGEAVSPISRV